MAAEKSEETNTSAQLLAVNAIGSNSNVKLTHRSPRYKLYVNQQNEPSKDQQKITINLVQTSKADDHCRSKIF